MNNTAGGQTNPTERDAGEHFGQTNPNGRDLGGGDARRGTNLRWIKFGPFIRSPR
jgi:hypothetical protein